MHPSIPLDVHREGHLGEGGNETEHMKMAMKMSEEVPAEKRKVGRHALKRKS